MRQAQSIEATPSMNGGPAVAEVPRAAATQAGRSCASRWRSTPSGRLSTRLRQLRRITQEDGTKPTIRQFIEMIRLAGCYQFSPGEYWLYRFHEAGVDLREILTYVPSKIHFSQVVPGLNQATEIPVLRNKWLFYLHCSALGLPTPRCHGVYDPSFGFTTSGDPLRSASDLTRFIQRSACTEIVTKPVAGWQGEGVRLFTLHRGNGVTELRHGGRTIDGGTLARLLAQDARDAGSSGIVIQDRIVQHPTLAAISPSAVANVRIITFRRRTGEVAITRTSARLGRDGRFTSNGSSGGVAVQIDPENGEIRGGRDSTSFSSRIVHRHPDTHVDLRGYRVPYWSEVRSLCLRAARVLPGLASVGWDVVVTPRGPILLEGNHDWGPHAEQMHGRGSGYLDRETRAILAEYDVHLPVDRLPRFRIGNVITAFSGRGKNSGEVMRDTA